MVNPVEKPYREKWREKNRKHGTPYNSGAISAYDSGGPVESDPMAQGNPIGDDLRAKVEQEEAQARLINAQASQKSGMASARKGGAIPAFDDGGAAPDMSAGGFGGGDQTPQAPSQGDQTQWGKSLGQDVGNVGGAIGGAVNNATASPSGQALVSGAQQAGSAVAQKTQAVRDYISGKGSMPPDAFEEANKLIDPRGTMDQNERSMRAPTVLPPNQITGYMQHLRQNYDLNKASAAKANQEGNSNLAADQLSKADQFIPNNQKTMITPTKDGYKITTHTMDGQDQTQEISKQDFQQYALSKHSLFDHLVNVGTGSAIAGHVTQLRAQTPQGQEFPGNQRPVGNEQAAIGEAGNTAPPVGGNPSSTDSDVVRAKGLDKDTLPGKPGSPGGPGYDPRTNDPNANYSEPGDNRTMVRQRVDPRRVGMPAGTEKGVEMETDADRFNNKPQPGDTGTPYTRWKTAQDRRNAVLSDSTEEWNRKHPDNQIATSEPGRTNINETLGNTAANRRERAEHGVSNYPSENPSYTDNQGVQRRQPTFTPPDERTEAERNEPISVINARVGSVERAAGKPDRFTYGNAQPGTENTPSEIQSAREQYPGDVKAQAKELNQQRSVRQAQGAEVEKSRQSGAARGESLAASRVKEALIKAQSVMGGTDKRFEGEQGRNATNILTRMMQNNPGADIGSLITELRKGGIKDDLINHLVNPSAKAAGGGKSRAPAAKQAPAAAAQQGELPQDAQDQLEEGYVTTFDNGSKWTLRGGKPTQVQ